MSSTEVNNKIKRHYNKLKYAAIIGVALLIAVDANAVWDLSKQIGDSIITPVAKAFKDWV